MLQRFPMISAFALAALLVADPRPVQANAAARQRLARIQQLLEIADNQYYMVLRFIRQQNRQDVMHDVKELIWAPHYKRPSQLGPLAYRGYLARQKAAALKYIDRLLVASVKELQKLPAAERLAFINNQLALARGRQRVDPTPANILIANALLKAQGRLLLGINGQ